MCRFDRNELSFTDGKALAEHEFDKKYTVESIVIDGGKFIISQKNLPIPTVSWVDEEETTFF